MNIDLAREYIVILNGGSGCLIQAMTDEYQYVLTAKHTITNNNYLLERLTRFKFENNGWSAIEIEMESFTEGTDYFFHPEKDIAIIKIPFLAGFGEAIRYDNLAVDKKEYSLLGYPGLRRNDHQNLIEWYRSDPNVQILDPRGDGMYEAQIPGNATLIEVQGSSGGAIVKVSNEKLFVAGIQNKMAEEEEQLGRVRFSPLSLFDEIVNLFPEKLKPILPCYFASFSFLAEETFNLEYGLLTEAKSIKLTKILRAKAIELSGSNLVPFEIKKFIKENLPEFHKQECYDNYNRKIWSLWLELLTVLNVAKAHVHVKEDLPSILKKVRFFYADSRKDFWVEHLRDLHKRDYAGLDDDAIVVVASDIKAKDGFHVIDFTIPANISLIRKSKEEFELGRIGRKTTIGIDFPLQKYRFMNISAFKEGTLEGVGDSFTEDELAICITSLKELYEQLIPNW